MCIRYCLFWLLSSAFIACQPRSAPDVIFTNAIIWTGDPAQPMAFAMAITAGRIAAIGTRVEVDNLRGPTTQVFDLKGRFVVPGFIDNHVHFLSGGHNLDAVQLRSASSPRQFIERLRDFAARRPAGEWITGGDWDHEAWGGALPHRSWIDSITTNHPVFVSRLDGHMALANSLALQLAGIDENTPDPPGGTIVRDSSGIPTGILKDAAMDLVFAVMPDPSPEALDRMFLAAQRHALSLGVTQVHDMGSFGGWTDLETYRRAHQRDSLHMRIYSFVPLATWQRLARFIADNGSGDDMLRWGGLKGFVDGSLGSSTAWFYEPYADDSTNTGLTVTDTSDLRRWIFAADSAGLQLAIHAIGDRANDWLLDTYQQAASSNPPHPRRRFRIEHAQHLRPEAIARFAEQQVIPSMQPYHAIDDGRWAEKRIGSERIRTTYAFRSLLDTGAKLTFGSDWTVAPLSPLEGIYAAVTRRTLDGSNPEGWVPEQKISVEEALRCYTVNNAWAGFQEDQLGVLKPGMLADFVVLSENLLEIPPEQLPAVRVLQTVVGGRTVYRGK